MTIVYSGANEYLLQHEVDLDLHVYSKWLAQNKLKLNTHKTVFMLFKQKIITISEKILLIVDDKLNWYVYIEHLKNKIVPLLGALYNCSKYLI